MKIELVFLLAILAGAVLGFISTLYVKHELSKPRWLHITSCSNSDVNVTVSLHDATEDELLDHIRVRHPEIDQLLKDYAAADTAIKKLMDDIND